MMDQAPKSKPAIPMHRDGQRIRRWLRVMLTGVLVLCLLVSVGLWVVTRSWFIISQIKPELERKLGGEVTIGKAVYQGDGRVVFTDMKLRARTLQGAAAEVARIDRAVVSVDLSRFFTSGVKLTNVELDNAQLRLSEDKHEGGKLNITGLSPDWSQRGGKAMVPPRVSIRQAALEFGSHHGADYEMLGRRLVSGEMYPTAGAGGWYNFELREVDENGAPITPDGVFIKGQWNAATNEHHSRIDGLELNDRIYNMCPQAARFWWRQMQLQGKVDGVVVNWTPNQPFSVELAVENVALTLPVETEGLWARYKQGNIEPTSSRPRMRVSSGTIRLRSDSIVLENLKGELGSSDAKADLAGVPYVVNFSMTSLPPIEWDNQEQWMQRVLKTAPLDLNFRVDEFSLSRNDVGESPAIDLPLLVAKVLAKFQVTDWVLSTSLEMKRSAPTIDDRGELVAAKPITTGQAYIRKASGRYQKFPYPLEDVDAYLQFDNDKVTVHYLTGKGSNGSELRISGEIAPPDNDAAVSLRLTGTNMPVDDRLRNALKDSELAAYDALFNKQIADSMAAAGLLPDQAAIDRAAVQRQALIDRLAEMKQQPNPDESQQSRTVAEVEASIARLQRSIEAGPFRLGGTVDLELKIERAVGPGQQTFTTGSIALHDVGAVFDKFPYPLRVSSGTLDWQKDRVVIEPGPNNQGLRFITPAGGQGSITGEMGLARIDGRRKMRPKLAVHVTDDEFNDAVYAAIPLTRSERTEPEVAAKWPGAALSKAARIVRGIGLNGACECNGVIDTDAEGKPTFDFSVSLQKGTAQPTLKLAESLGLAAEPWPVGTALDDVRGSLAVNRDRIQWTGITGRTGSSTVTTDGDLILRGENIASSIHVGFQNLPLDRYLLNLVPPIHMAQAENIWVDYAPQGAIDAAFDFRSPGADESFMAFTIQPRDISVLIDSHEVQLSRAGGSLTLDGNLVRLEQLALNMKGADDRPDGTLTLNGEIGLRDEDMKLTGTWSDGAFESPLITQAMRDVHADRQLEMYRQCRPTGVFNADFQIQSPALAAADGYEIHIQPKSLAFNWNDTLIDTEMDAGDVVIRPGMIVLEDVSGHHSGGSFQISGGIGTDGPVDANLSVRLDGHLRAPQVLAFLPQQAKDTLDAVKFDDGGSNTLVDLDVHARHTGQDESQSPLAVDVIGSVQTRGASFDAGVRFDDFNGEFQLALHYMPGTPLGLNVQVRAQDASVLGQKLTNIETSIALNEEGDLVEVDGFRAEAGSGLISAQAAAGVGPRTEYQLEVQLVGVPLLGFAPAGVSTPASDAGRDPQGDLYGNLTLSGQRGDASSRHGRATLRVLHGKMASVPLALQLMQMVQLTLPFGGSLDFADADMYVTGDRIVFEHILFESTLGKNAMLQLLGEGEMNANTLELDTRFRSRSGVAIIREVGGIISDKLYGIHVTGPLGNPQARIIPLPPN